MKRLYITRHAKSTRNYPELPDFERPLNERGRQDAPEMGATLKSMGVKPDLIVSSPAARAIATARLIAGQLDYPLNKIQVFEEIYEAWTENLLHVIKTADANNDSIMLVGHNPGLLLLAEHLTDFPYGHVPTCSVVAIDLNIDRWEDIGRDNGKLVFFEVPKKKET